MFFLGLAAGFALTLGWLERRRPLRPATDPRPGRVARNVASAALTATAAAVLDRPLCMALARRVEREGQGVLQRLPAPLRDLAALIVLDYALYLWHVALHRNPTLWRAHVVHHTDQDLDVSTALRFHVAEILASVAWRLALVRWLGIGPRPLQLYQQVLFLSVLFHHSNLRLPPDADQSLARFVVTPRLHGIHHSEVPEEMDSNWASVLTVWDRLHGTYRDDVPQERIRIGVRGYPRSLGLGEMLALPAQAPPDA
jgi:sterol desaturase/sphingolipid hydroxylase (fatty acid hydroxylase superfamily)